MHLAQVDQNKPTPFKNGNLHKKKFMPRREGMAFSIAITLAGVCLWKPCTNMWELFSFGFLIRRDPYCLGVGSRGYIAGMAWTAHLHGDFLFSMSLFMPCGMVGWIRSRVIGYEMGLDMIGREKKKQKQRMCRLGWLWKYYYIYRFNLHIIIKIIMRGNMCVIMLCLYMHSMYRHIYRC